MPDTPLPVAEHGPANDARADDGRCRLCGAATHEKFVGRVLGRYRCRYLECVGCGSLQTETPTWLDEAYASNLSMLDTGAVQRNLVNCAAVLAVCRTLGLRDVLDHGGGDGLLCRMLRDYGLNAYVGDLHARPTYAPAFTRPDFARPQLLVAFEVFEHFAEPEAELARCFAAGPDVALASTGIYEGQGADWWYLSGETGQHVFFYSMRGLALAGRRLGYTVRRIGAYVLFHRHEAVSAYDLVRLKVALHRRSLTLARAALAFRDAPGVQADFTRLREPPEV